MKMFPVSQRDEAMNLRHRRVWFGQVSKEVTTLYEQCDVRYLGMHQVRVQGLVHRGTTNWHDYGRIIVEICLP